jgi:hypothetical protein
MAYNSKSYRKFLATGATAALVATAIAPAASAAEHNFNDVSTNYEEAVSYLFNNKIVNGLTDTTFGTYMSLTRGDAAVIIAHAKNLDVDNAADAGFTDVNSRVAGAANALVEAGIMSGKNSTTFAPNEKLTRGQMAKILVNAYDLQDQAVATPFTDVNATFDKYIKAIYGAKITGGKTPTTFGTNLQITRGDFANLLYKSIKFVDVTPAPVDATVSGVSAVNGTVTVSFDKAVEAVTAGDFKVSQAIDGKASTDVTPSAVKLSEDKKSAELTVAEVAKSAAEQSVVVSVAYKAGVAKSATAYKVDAATADVAKVESVSAINDITVNEGETLSLPAKVGVTYNDSTTGDVAVVWNTTSVDTAKVGTYTVTGTIEGTDKTASVKVIVVAAAPKVASVSAITATDVTVTFDKAFDTAGEQTLVLVKGDKEYSAKATVAVGDKTAKFVFTAPLTEDGEYMVKDTTVKATLNVFAEAAAVKAVNDATNQVQLLNALSSDVFKRVNGNNIAAYLTARDAISSELERDTVAEIQMDIIDSVNTLVSVNSASNQVELLTALNAGVTAGALKDVNASLIAKYDADLDGSQTTVTEIQTVITAVNAANLSEAEQVAAATKAVEDVEGAIAAAGNLNATQIATLGTKIDAAHTSVQALPSSSSRTSLVSRLAQVDVLENTVNDVILSESDISDSNALNVAQLDVYRLAASPLKTALQSRIDKYSPVLNFNGATNVNEATTVLLGQNPTGFTKLNPTNRTAVATEVFASDSDYRTVTAYNNAVSDAIAKASVVQEVSAATTESQVLTALKAGANVKLANNSTILTSVTDANAPVYKAKADALIATDKNTVIKIQTAIIGAANTDVTTANTAVTTLETTPSTANVTSADAAVVVLPTSDIKKSLDARVKVVDAELDFDPTKVSSAQTAINALSAGTLKTSLQTRINVIGYVSEVNASTTVADVQDVLTRQDPKGFSALSNELKTEVATAVYASGANYTTVALYNTAVATAITVATVNNATTATAAVTALTPVALAVTSSDEYLNLTSAEKLEVASLFLDMDDADRTGLVAAEYTTVADIKTDLEAVTADYTGFLGAVNAADTITETNAALSAIGYAKYDDLSSTKKLEVSEKFLASFPMTTGTTPERINYKTLAAIELAIDNAIVAAN